MARPRKNKEEYVEFSFFLRSMRSVTDLTSFQMARRLGIKEDTYLRYEHGHRLPNPARREQIVAGVRKVVRKEIERKRKENAECVC